MSYERLLEFIHGQNFNSFKPVNSKILIKYQYFSIELKFFEKTLKLS